MDCASRDCENEATEQVAVTMHVFGLRDLSIRTEVREYAVCADCAARLRAEVHRDDG